MTKTKLQADNILNLISRRPEGCWSGPIPNGNNTLPPNLALGDIEFKSVWFKYPNSDNSQWILKNFNLKIKANQSLGILGDSNSGKSTIAQLLYRFYDPQHGDITIGGYSIKMFNLKSLRSYFGIVNQEPLLFNFSIMDNLTYSKPQAN